MIQSLQDKDQYRDKMTKFSIELMEEDLEKLWNKWPQQFLKKRPFPLACIHEINANMEKINRQGKENRDRFTCNGELIT